MSLNLKKVPAGSILRLKVQDLSPTQCGVGMLEIDEKSAKIASKSPKALEDYLFSRPVPAIIGPKGKCYITDHHHLTYSMYVAKVKAKVVVEVQANWSAYISERQFWKRMQASGYVYLYDIQGGGPIRPDQLPKGIKDMKDDPYRSLSWLMRQDAVYLKDPSRPLFAEFVWADFFRKHIILDGNLLKNGKKKPFTNPCLSFKKKCCTGKLSTKEYDKANSDCQDFQDVLATARGLAISADAKGLPGYTGNA